MAPPTKRCYRCRDDKQKCKMLGSDTEACERCARKGYTCEGYGWPPPRNPRLENEQDDSNTAADEPESSNTHTEHTSSQRLQSSTSYDRQNWVSNHPRPGANPNDSNSANFRNQSTFNPEFRSFSGNGLLARSEPRPQAQPSSGAVLQQNPAWFRPSGYNDTGASLGSSFGNSVPQSTGWLYTQQYMPDQTNQSRGWYGPGRQGQRSNRSGQYPPSY